MHLLPSHCISCDLKKTIMQAITLLLTTIIVLHAVSGQSPPGERPTEEERVKLWYERGNVWPPEWQDESEGMKRLLAHREVELQTGVLGADERWENWLQLTQNRLIPKFTQKGFAVIKTPDAVHAKLKAAVDAGVARFDSLPSEGEIDVIYHPKGMAPKFVRLGSLQTEVIEDLRELHEQWGGMKLQATSAYGVRLYQNGSSLVMHQDKVHTHVISSIVHIAHEYDDPDEPWPIEIEDHDGNLHAVALEPGQMLFYESAKCLHGRMQTFKGKYYGSIFLHYKPVDTSIWNYSVDQIIENIPPHWRYGIDNAEGKGSRWAGACVTVDSRTADGAPARTHRGKVNKETLPHNFAPLHPPPEHYPGEGDDEL
jgi:hypothetical protein